MNIRVDLTTPIKDGTEVVFRSPVDCSQITGLIVYVTENGNTTSQEFALADAHGNNVGDIDHLFAENVVVKVILDVAHSMAFVQNADTNAYLESRFADVFDKLCPTVTENGELVQITSFEGMPLTITGAFAGYLVISVCGKNLYDAEKYPLVANTIVRYGNGTTGTSNAFSGTLEYIPVAHLCGKQIAIKHSPYSTNGSTGAGMAFYDYNKSYIKEGSTRETVTTVPDDAWYMRFSINKDYAHEAQIELGNAVTDYEPGVITTICVHERDGLPAVIEARKGVTTIWAIDEANTDLPINLTVTGKADPVALIDKLMKTVFPATISNEEV